MTNFIVKLFRIPLILWCVFLIAGCGRNEQDSIQSAPEHVSQEVKRDVNVENSTKEDAYYSEAELIQEGFRVVKAGNDGSLLCDSADDSNCTCLEPLPCLQSESCTPFSESIKIFKAALHNNEGAQVDCRLGELGHCGTFQYFDFRGDIGRREIRWFDRAGNLIGLREAIDYKAYCNGKTRKRFLGRIPKCLSSKSDELICGEAVNHGLNALDSLRSIKKY